MAKKKITDISQLVEIYKSWSQEKLDEEIDAFFDIGFALLETTQCDSIDMFPNPSIKLTFTCEVIKDEKGKYYS